MLDQLTAIIEIAALVPAALALSWVVRRAIRALTRRSVRRGQQNAGSWRVRLPRGVDVDGQEQTRKRQRADAAARMLGHFVTGCICVGAVLVGLNIVGADAVVMISSAGFIGVALALSGQELIRNLITGTVALLEDRYAVGDEVVLRVSGQDVGGTIDVVGAASVRLRTAEGATWHAGHSSIECVTNLSQLPAVHDIVVPTSEWDDAELDAHERLAAASNDVGLTGIIFLRDLDAHRHPSGTTTVQVKANRPLTEPQVDRVKSRLLGD
jgi:small-conductance mechanosensitive channel